MRAKHGYLAVVAASLVALGPAVAAPQESARFMYEEAFAREHVLRGDLDAPETGVVPRPTVLQVHAVIAAYEAIVRRYPRSAYCDNALWQAAGLAGEALRRWQDDGDRLAAMRLLRRLIKEYPSSSLVPNARDALAAYEPASPPGPAPASAGQPAAKPETPLEPFATLRAISRTEVPGVVRVTVEFDREVAYRTERIDAPARVLFDFSPTRMAAGLGEGVVKGTADAVPRVRVGRHPADTVRVVIDLDGVKRYSVYPLYDPYRLVVDCELVQPVEIASPTEVLPVPTPAATQPPPPRLESRTLPSRMAGTAPSPAAPAPRPVLGAADWPALYVRPPASVRSSPPPHPTVVDPAEPPVKAPSPAGAKAASPAPPSPDTPPKPAPPAANAAGGYSLARQLGLGVSRIVIDPGHGGHDPGAEGAGTTEADVVLDVALRLERLLLDVPGVEVVMTRRRDEFVPLEQRTETANRAEADLFLSIHANASRNRSVAGVETYYLNFATSPDAEAVAARENASTQRTMNNLPEIVKAIAQNNKLDESRDFARQVQQAMVKRLRPANRSLKDLGVKHAPFVVLIGAGMPSALAEISFITNAGEGRLLRNATFRQRVADALFEGITRYQQSLKASMPVRPQ